jgi:hypothetical protein
LSTRLSKRTPMQVLTGDAVTTPIALVWKENVLVKAPPDFIRAQKILKVEKLSKAMIKIRV